MRIPGRTRAETGLRLGLGRSFGAIAGGEGGDGGRVGG